MADEAILKTVFHLSDEKKKIVTKELTKRINSQNS